MVCLSQAIYAVGIVLKFAEEVLWFFLRALSRLNRDYNPLIHQREEAVPHKDFEEVVFNRNVEESIFGKDFEVCLEEKIAEFKNVLLLGALITFSVLAFYQRKRRNDSKQDNSVILEDLKLFRNGVPEELQQKLLHLHSLLSILQKENSSKSWLYNFLSILPCNFNQKHQKIKESCLTKSHLTIDSSEEKYWNEVERGLRESLKSLNTVIDPTSSNFNSTDMKDKSTQVNEELVFQLLEGGFEVGDTAAKPQILAQANGFNNIVLREQTQMELVANNRAVPLKQVSYQPRCPHTEMPLSGAPTSNLEGNVLNIQIEFDTKVLLGKLSK